MQPKAHPECVFLVVRSVLFIKQAAIGTSCFFVVRSPEVFYNRFITCVRCFSNGCREANLGEK